MADTKSIRVVGYVREDKEIDLQIDALRREGVAVIYIEKEVDLNPRLELERCLGSLSSGDVLMVYGVEKVALSLLDFIAISARISDAGASIKSLTQPVDTAGPAGQFMLKVLKEVAASAGPASAFAQRLATVR